LRFGCLADKPSHVIMEEEEGGTFESWIIKMRWLQDCRNQGERQGERCGMLKGWKKKGRKEIRQEQLIYLG
jgi:hypothetical protein